VLGNVLCEVPVDQKAFLLDLDRRLKPGGRIVFLEHVKSSNPVVASFQDLINPAFTVIAGGCNCNRDSLHALKSIPGWEVRHVEFFSSAPFFINKLIAGVVEKSGIVPSAHESNVSINKL